MKRPMLITGITAVVASALLFLFRGAYTIILPVSAVVLIFYFIKPLGIRKHVAIPTICITSILIVLSFLCYNKANVSPYLKYHHSENIISGKIISTPTVKDGTLFFEIKAEKIGTDKVSTTITVNMPFSEDTSPELYDYVALPRSQITVAKDENGNYDLTDISDGIFLYASADSADILYQCTKTPYYYCMYFRAAISDAISVYMSHDFGGLLKGMIFGDSSSISDGTINAFRNSGISHLLAVSGLHTSLWCGLLIAILSSFKLRERTSAFICISFLLLFCIISGLTPSVIRASVMMTIILIAPFFKRMSDGINSLGLAVTLLILQNPYIITSISFQLSACATLGVLVARSFYPSITKRTHKIKFAPLKAPATALVKSVLISCLAGLFTLPVSSYYFGTLCTVAPLTNVLCVQLAFYGMVIGTVAVFLTFISASPIKSIAILLFNITEFILNIVIQISTKISQLKYATIPVRSEFLFIALIIGAMLLLIGMQISKKKRSKVIIRVTALCTALITVGITFIPLYIPQFKNTVTIADCGNNLQLVIRSGLSYAYVESSDSFITVSTKKALPVATSESLKFYIPTYLSGNGLKNIESVNERYSPEGTFIPEALQAVAKNKGIALDPGTIICSQGEFTLSSEITFEIIDTIGIKYVIIKCNNKTILIHLYGETDFYKVIDDTDCFVAVYNSVIPQNTPKNASKVILSMDTDYDAIELADFQSRTKASVHVTARDGNAVVYF